MTETRAALEWTMTESGQFVLRYRMSDDDRELWQIMQQGGGLIAVRRHMKCGYSRALRTVQRIAGDILQYARGEQDRYKISVAKGHEVFDAKNDTLMMAARHLTKF